MEADEIIREFAKLEEKLSTNHGELKEIVGKHERALFGNNGTAGALAKLDTVDGGVQAIAAQNLKVLDGITRVYWALATGAMGIIGTLGMVIFKLLWEKKP